MPLSVKMLKQIFLEEIKLEELLILTVNCNFFTNVFYCLLLCFTNFMETACKLKCYLEGTLAIFALVYFIGA